MPQFDYRCPVCGWESTRIVRDPDTEIFCNRCASISDEPTVVMAKLPSAPSFRIKGYAAKNGYSNKT